MLTIETICTLPESRNQGLLNKVYSIPRLSNKNGRLPSLFHPNDIKMLLPTYFKVTPAPLLNTCELFSFVAVPWHWSTITPVRVKDGMSLWNGMWHGVRNGIIMRNTIYAGNKLTEERDSWNPYPFIYLKQQHQRLWRWIFRGGRILDTEAFKKTWNFKGALIGEWAS